ncbi:ABC transporter permease [Sanguibacter suaedae]|uniref:ABC transporter permease n=1 Tax=Sanguibacter suaedae TaxID=2795737 RepID=A0A934MEG4_9MICO|nr:ABC transporter permease [Sanguibacter suaedae]MBI9115664.1 ABC transporter permease [Sanguibacter suaedae]
MSTSTSTTAPTGAPTPAPEDTHAPAAAPGVVKNPWLVVTTREVVVKLTDRNFIVSTLVTLALIIVGVGASAYFGNRTADHTVAVVSTEATAVVDASQAIVGADDSGDTVTAQEVADEDAARQAVRDGDADAALLDTGEGWVIVGDEEVDSGLAGALTDTLAASVLEANATEAGTTTAELMAGSEVTTELLTGDEGQAGLRYAAGTIFAFLFYFSAIIFGMAIANSVLEEKQNRVVEILATAIPVRQLLYGKVLGNSILAFGQIAIYAIVALVAVNITGVASDLGWLLGASGWFIVFFVGGFTALAAVWAVLGSLASRSEDLQSNTGPITTVIMAALFVGLLADGMWLTIASYVPIVSSVAMPIRVLDGSVPVWEPLVSLAVTVVTAYLLLRLGEKVYQRAVMQGGTALTWRQALKLEV